MALRKNKHKALERDWDKRPLFRKRRKGLWRWLFVLLLVSLATVIGVVWWESGLLAVLLS